MAAILFDFDGVIIDSEWAVYESWLNLFKREGHDLPITTYVQCIGSDFGGWSPETFLEELTEKEFDWDHENALRQIEIETNLEQVQPLPGVVELFEWLQANDVPAWIVSSSTHRWVDGWMEKLDLAKYVKGTVCREDAEKVKPDPGLYLEGVRQSGLAAERCIVIEDSLNGIKSGNVAGCLTLALPSHLTNCLDFTEADRQFKTMDELTADIQQTVAEWRQ